jgi:hypothetical protein
MKPTQGLDLGESCRDCKLKSSAFFCGLPDASLKAGRSPR